MRPLVRSWHLIPRALLVLALVAVGSQTARAGGLPSGLVAYDHLDGNGLDSSGNGLDLSLVGNPNFGLGLFGEAIGLHDDGSQYATQPGNDAAFHFGSSNVSIQV